MTGNIELDTITLKIANLPFRFIAKLQFRADDVLLIWKVIAFDIYGNNVSMILIIQC